MKQIFHENIAIITFILLPISIGAFYFSAIYRSPASHSYTKYRYVIDNLHDLAYQPEKTHHGVHCFLGSEKTRAA